MDSTMPSVLLASVCLLLCLVPSAQACGDYGFGETYHCVPCYGNDMDCLTIVSGVGSICNKDSISGCSLPSHATHWSCCGNCELLTPSIDSCTFTSWGGLWILLGVGGGIFVLCVMLVGAGVLYKRWKLKQMRSKPMAHQEQGVTGGQPAWA